MLNIYLKKDARHLCDIVKKPIIDVVITSPPYADIKNYGTRNQIGYGQHYEREYLPSLEKVFGQVFKITKNSGALWIVVDTFRRNRQVRLLPFDIASICKKVGWTLSDIIIWDKGKTLPWSHKGRLRNVFEYILFFTKSEKYKYYVDRIKDPIDLKEWWVKYPERYSLGGKIPSNVWRIPIPVQGSWAQDAVRHFCPFPPELVERILLLTTDKGDVVLDPFAGSGIVLAQALCMQRKFLGFDTSGRYVRYFKTKVLPVIRRQWKETQKEMRQLERRRKVFETKIRTLRLLKYPKAILKSLKSRRPEMLKEIKAIFIDKEIENFLPSKSHKFVRAKVTFFTKSEDPHIEEHLKELINLVITKPPVSKFGITPVISVRSASGYLNKIRNTRQWNGHKCFIYANGRTHYFKEKIKMRDLEAKFVLNGWGHPDNGELPPIISPIGIRQVIGTP